MFRFMVLLALVLPLSAYRDWNRPDPETFYPLQFQMSGQAEWASVEFLETGRLLTLRFRDYQGPSVSHRSSMLGVFVEGNVRRESFLLDTEYLVAGEEGQTIPIRVVCGNGHLHLRVQDTQGRVLLDRDFGSEHAYQDVWLDPAPIPAKTITDGMRERMVARGQIPRRFWAFYYLWYPDEWEAAHLSDLPLSGTYPSWSERAMARHLDEARDAGLDGFVVSWWGAEDVGDASMPTLLDLAAQRGMKIQFYLETVRFAELTWMPEILDREALLDRLRYLLDTYGQHPAVYRVGGRPVVAVYLSFLRQCKEWESIFRTLREEGRDAIFLADYKDEWPSLDVLNVFDGLHTYNPLNIVQNVGQVDTYLRDSYEKTGKALRYRELFEEDRPPLYWVPSVLPGYDDHLLEGRNSPVLDRQGGELFRAIFNYAVDSNPQWIYFTSWNEWWENTHIEPSVRYGSQYVELTREFAFLWKFNWMFASPL